jgi:GDP-L-fucose synthase
MVAAKFSLAGKRVWVAGHRGMVGSALVRRLQSEACEILTAERSALDLLDQSAVHAYLRRVRPHAIILAAAKVGGILANDRYPADFLYENLVIETNVIHGAYLASVDKLLLLGSSCIYPKFAPQPIVETALLTGPLEPTNEWYAIAKIAGIKLCQAYQKQHGCDFISAMPTNLYGPGDNFDLETSHVIPALIRKAHLAKRENNPEMIIWGTGQPRRDFLHVDDAANALVLLLHNYSGLEHINVGSGSDISILELADFVADVVAFRGSIVTDPSKPDGTPRKVLDISLLRSLGWTPRLDLKGGLDQTYRWFCEHFKE